MHTLFTDIRFGVRMLLKNPGFSAVAALTLALGIGANTAVFSLVYTLMWKPLAYPKAEQLYTIRALDLDTGNDTSSVSLQNYLDWREQSTAFQSMGLYFSRNHNLSGNERPERVRMVHSTASFLDTLELQPQVGRFFEESEETPGQDRVVLLFHEFWQRRFDADPDAIGQTLTLDDETYTIIGVLPENLMSSWGPDDLWAPLGIDTATWVRANRSHRVMARLKDDISPDAAQAEMSAISARLGEAYPEENGRWSNTLRPLRVELVGADGGTALALLMGAVLFVLLIACANVANLLLARANARRAELAVRTALGAGRWRLVRQMLTECVILASVGALLGIVLAQWGLSGLQLLLRPREQAQFDFAIDRPVLVFTLGATLLSVMAFGLMPALLTTTSKFAGSIVETARVGASRVRRRRGHDLLVMSQIAMALALVISTGFMVKSFLAINRVDPGFETNNLLTLRLNLPRYQFDDDLARTQYLQMLCDDVLELPGVEHVGGVWTLPLSGSNSSSWATLEGYDNPDPSRNIDLGRMSVTPGYFDALGIPLLEGRDFGDQDQGDSAPVVIVNRAVAERFWPGESAVGQRLAWGAASSPGPMRTIIGVVDNVLHSGLDGETRPEVFDPFAQSNHSAMTLVIRTETDPAAMASAVQSAIWRVDPDQVIYAMRSMDEVVHEDLGGYHIFVRVLLTLAFVALFLASVGLYGVMSYTVLQRTRELGIRVALGAQSRDVIWLVMRKALLLTTVGAGIGLLMGAGIGVLTQSLMFGVTPADPTIFVVVLAVLIIVGLMATYVPTRRALAVDPINALRYE